MWDVEIPLIIRHMIDDLGDTPTYTDNRLAELVLVSALVISTQTSFQYTYTIDIDSFSITPDPTDRDTRDDAFVNLVCLQAACRLATAEAKTAAGQAIDIRDGNSAVGLRGIAPSKLAIAKQFCQNYEDAKYAYMAGNRAVGQAIVSPFRVYANNYLANSNCRHNMI